MKNIFRYAILLVVRFFGSVLAFLVEYKKEFIISSVAAIICLYLSGLKIDHFYEFFSPALLGTFLGRALGGHMKGRNAIPSYKEFCAELEKGEDSEEPPSTVE
jgi:hypothetical protein